MTAITHKRLLEVLNYDAESGVFTWKVKASKNTVIGEEAGSWRTEAKDRPIRIRIDGKSFRAHRLAWFYVNGAWPNGLIDHINGNCHDNRLCNLRDVTQSVNQQNLKKAKKTNKIGLLGVNSENNKYRAKICINRKSHDLGLFKSPSDAHQAYLKAKRILHEGNTL